jgi:NADPH-dependent 2,4-dienoyl-CoA reductase/sulfur reductase-like enzyme
MEELLPSSGGTEASVIKMCVKDMVDYYNIEVRTGSALQEVTDTGVIVKKSNGETEAIHVDSVVLSAGFKINPTFARELYGCGFEVFEITGGGAGIPNVSVLRRKLMRS